VDYKIPVTIIEIRPHEQSRRNQKHLIISGLQNIHDGLGSDLNISHGWGEPFH